ncbi:type II toxin-antitoxin system HicB family antitoxin [Orrella sp. 11846]|uniref:type II toxin-antitoxin system HicB family antitoxin n=1 Tax=Orrella sp. 11846 TaxID=3409913 RepID=UPI003B59DA99
MKSNLLTYKGYHGSIEPSLRDKQLKGHVLFIQEEVRYQARTLDDIRRNFERAIDDYLTRCLATGRTPERPFRGQFNVRVTPDLHKLAALRAEQDQTSLNSVVVNALRAYLLGDQSQPSDTPLDMAA